MGLIIILVIAVGLVSVLSSLAMGLGKVILWVVMPLFIMLIVGALIANVAGPQVGALGAVATLFAIIACAKKIFS